MDEMDEAEFKINAQNLYSHGGVVNVLDCIISMQEVSLIILKKLKEIISKEK